MPTYEYECWRGHVFERVLRVDERDAPQTCKCEAAGRRVILSPPIGFVSQDVHYRSPIDGSPITSRDARREDLKRSGCIEYDPGMKQDYHRRIAEGERALDATVDSTVEAAFERMPAAKKERLANEMTGGLSAEMERGRAGFKTVQPLEVSA